MFSLYYVARRLCFAIWMSSPAGGFLFLAAVPGGTPWSGPVLWVLWTNLSLSSWEVDFMPVWSGDLDRDLSRAPASVDSLAIADSRPVFPGDEGFQHGHEMGSRIHLAERPDPSGMISEEVSSRCLCPASLVARSSVGSWRDPCGVEDEDLAMSLSSEPVPLWRTMSETMQSGRYRSLGVPSRDLGSASSERSPFARPLDLWSLGSRDLRSLL
ncbi:hypothetical protein F2Q70_00022094 [Brassica cretica]|uniref:Uncharacterized protein n=1 Tax=Brassica cretica TaxID=69181 RepID=A0A8S9GKD1_BRACR|nr:hypothetical protein F2Q70_00022094 [Brassica cretica]KAF3516160.1 hypothetical protein DY000_02058615 [Brassica cretica]